MKIPVVSDFRLSFHDPVWLTAAEQICLRHDLQHKNLRRAEHGENIGVLIDEAFVLKIYRPDRNGTIREQTALKFASDKTSLRAY